MGNINIVINNFNRLSTTKKLVDDLNRLGYGYIHIIDNGSTYPPLLDWYEELRGTGEVTVYMAGKGNNQLALWNTGYINLFKDNQYIVYTDSDIELNEHTPEGFIDVLLMVANYSGLGGKMGINKAGLALKINDLPDNEMCRRVIKHESQFWTNKIEHGSMEVYQSDIDTTFAVINPIQPFTYKALRVAGNFTAKHIPWYIDFGNISEEEKYVLDNSDPQISTYRRDYDSWLNKKVTA